MSGWIDIKPEYEERVIEFSDNSTVIKSEETFSTNYMETGFYYQRTRTLRKSKNGGKYWVTDHCVRTVHLRNGPRILITHSYKNPTTRSLVYNTEYMEKFSFPLLKYWEYKKIDIKYWHALKAGMSTNPKTIANNVFEGPTPKVNLENQYYLEYLNLLAVGKGIYNPQKIRDSLTTATGTFWMTFNARLEVLNRANYVLRRYNISFEQFLKAEQHILSDALLLIPQKIDFRRVPQKKIRTIQELHDFLYEYANVHKILELKKTVYKKMPRLVYGDYTLIFPTTAYDMFRWGREQNHCIGSYTSYHQFRNNLFFEVQFQGEVIGHAQTVGKKVVQFYGKYNSIPDIWHQMSLETIVEERFKE